MKATGMNTATMASEVATTANPISEIPASAASMRGFPSSMWRNEFSNTTIESSITMPTEMLSARSDIMFRVKPMALMKVNVPMIVVGMVTAATNAPRGFAQEKEDDQDRQDAATDELTLCVVKTVRHEHRQVLGEHKPVARRQPGADLVQLALHAVGDRKQVLARLTTDEQGDGLLPV